MENEFEVGEALAKKLDNDDPLADFPSKFYIPENTIYMNGNSLGLLPKKGEKTLLRVLEEWKTVGVKGWVNIEQPWFFFAEKLGEKAASLVGAKPSEVIATGTTTINIHSLISTFYEPVGKKTKILADVLNFPTDIYALQSQVKLKGLDPKENLILVESENGRFLEEETIIDAMTEEIAIILLPSALFRSGQLLDMKYLTEEAHKRGILIGWDCSHSVGVVPHYFDEWGVDFAIWCSYKYLNAGPGASAFLYVNEKHFNKEAALSGWFGYVKEKQFEMNLHFEQAKNAGGWQISSPSILGSAALEGALDLILEAGIDEIREKSLKMTSYMIFLVDELLSKEPYIFSVGTPREEERRGGHVALEHKEAYKIHEELLKKNVVHDFRPPNIVRITPSALYNTYAEIWEVISIIKNLFD
ncbi:MAG: kynureninase [Candidatus Heimdallarchaeota archaeon]|nr:kynureninase [Candidatus Heimdallarchaeota archaeon]MCK4955583.1 kynureninase [Candidatus Heimdallarchaeota archaeon]